MTSRNLFDFKHLPQPGGILDQDPQTLDDWHAIAKIDALYQERERKKAETQ